MTRRESWDDYDIEEMAIAVRRVAKTVTRTTREHPYAAIALAAGLGFVAAGGLRSRTGRGLLALAVRLALPQLQAVALSTVANMAGATASADNAAEASED